MRGWAVPVATDIAFALAVLSLLGNRVPIGLKVFLTALAIIDDLGAIVVIALFYSAELRFPSLLAAAALVALLWTASKSRVNTRIFYIASGVILWLLVLRSGVHPTLSGVAFALVIPSQNAKDGRGPSVALWMERKLEPIVAYVILPLFGLVNAGLEVAALSSDVLTSSLFLGTATALVIGKQVGVFGAVMVAMRSGFVALPAGVSKVQLYGASVICGVGFTMSLFIGGLAFGGSFRENEVKLAVLAASLTSAVIGSTILAAVSRRTSNGAF